MKTKTLAVALVLCLCAPVGIAQTNEEIKQAVGEVASELQQCSVYFLLLSTCIDKQDPALSLSCRKAADKVSELAVSTGRTSGFSDEALMARGQLLSEAMMKSMDGNCINIAVPMKKIYELLSATSPRCRSAFDGMDQMRSSFKADL